MTYADEPVSSTSPHVKITDYAVHIGKSRKTVVRMITDGRLPQATQDEKGVWWIPLDAVPLEAPDTGNTIVLLGPPAPRVEPTDVAPTPSSTDVELVPQAGPPISTMGALVTLEEAALVLGTSVGGIRRLGDAGRLDIGPYGPFRALRVYLPNNG